MLMIPKSQWWKKEIQETSYEKWWKYWSFLLHQRSHSPLEASLWVRTHKPVQREVTKFWRLLTLKCFIYCTWMVYWNSLMNIPSHTKSSCQVELIIQVCKARFILGRLNLITLAKFHAKYFQNGNWEIKIVHLNLEISCKFSSLFFLSFCADPSYSSSNNHGSVETDRLKFTTSWSWGTHFHTTKMMDRSGYIF